MFNPDPDQPKNTLDVEHNKIRSRLQRRTDDVHTESVIWTWPNVMIVFKQINYRSSDSFKVCMVSICFHLFDDTGLSRYALVIGGTLRTNERGSNLTI